MTPWVERTRVAWLTAGLVAAAAPLLLGFSPVGVALSILLAWLLFALLVGLARPLSSRPSRDRAFAAALRAVLVAPTVLLAALALYASWFDAPVELEFGGDEQVRRLLFAVLGPGSVAAVVIGWGLLRARGTRRDRGAFLVLLGLLALSELLGFVLGADENGSVDFAVVGAWFAVPAFALVLVRAYRPGARARAEVRPVYEPTA